MAAPFDLEASTQKLGKLSSPLLQSDRLVHISLKTKELFVVTRPLLQPAAGGKKLVVGGLGRVLTRPFLQSHGSLRFGSAAGGCCVCDSQNASGGILYKSLGFVYATRSGRRAGWLCSQDRSQAYPFAISACGRAGSLFHCSSVGSLPWGCDQKDVRNVRMGSWHSWLSSW